MPPQQCPACGRFLKNAFVVSLTDEPTPCPRCDEALVAEMFAAASATGTAREPSGAGPATAAAAPTPAGAARTPGADEPSVRPPDLEPERVRDDPAEVLAGWDRGQAVGEVTDRPPVPVDALVLLAAGVSGGLLGALFGERGGRGAALGAVGGVVGAAVARRVWRLE